VRRFRNSVSIFSLTEGGTPNNDLVRAPSSDFFCTSNSSNAATDAHLHSELLSRTLTEFAYEAVVLALAHGRVQVDDVQPGIFIEFL